MGIASLILGIVSIIIGFIPFCGMIAIIPAIIGLILGIVDLVKKSKLDKKAKEAEGEFAQKQKKGVSIAGVILNPIAIVVIIVWTLVLSVAIYDGASNSIIDSAYNYEDEFSNALNSSSQSSTLASVKSGETYTGENLKITYVSSDTNFTDYGKYNTVTNGNKVIKVDFVFENIGTESQYVSPYNFDCYADGFACETFYNSNDSSTLSSTLSANKKVSGSVYFEVPTDSESITLEYEVSSYPEKIVEFVIE